MTNHRIRTTLWTLAFLLLATSTMVGCGGVNSMGGPSIAGTYRLYSRELPDGTMQKAPDIDGLITFTKDYRNFNVSWMDTSGKRYSRSGIARYKLGQGVYSETNIYYFINEASGMKFDVSPVSGSAPTTHANRTLEFQLPLHEEPNLVFDNNGFTATIHGQFKDRWERVN